MQFLTLFLVSFPDSDETERNQWIYSLLHTTLDKMKEKTHLFSLTREVHYIRPYTKKTDLICSQE